MAKAVILKKIDAMHTKKMIGRFVIKMINSKTNNWYKFQVVSSYLGVLISGVVSLSN